MADISGQQGYKRRVSNRWLGVGLALLALGFYVGAFFIMGLR